MHPVYVAQRHPDTEPLVHFVWKRTKDKSSPATSAAERSLAALSPDADWHTLSETGHHMVCHGIWPLGGMHTHLPGENLIDGWMLFPLHFGTGRMTPAIATASASVNPSGSNTQIQEEIRKFSRGCRA